MKPFYDDPDFFQFVLGSMCNKVFTLGANIVVHYYGQQCEFCVVLANGKKKPESFINTLNDSALEMNCIDVTTNCERLANLSLNDSSISVDNQSVGGLLSVDSEAWPSSSSTPKYQRDELCNCERSKPHLTDNIYYVNLNTKLTIKRSGFTALGNEVIHTKQINFDDIGGLDRQINEIRQLLFPSENGSKIFSSYGR